MKKMLINFFGFIFLIYLSSCTSTEKANVQNTKNEELVSFMVYGDDFLASIVLPFKWNVNMAYAQQVGINGFFYLRNYNTENSPAVIILELEYNNNKIFKEWIDNDINTFLAYYEDFSVEMLNWNVVNENGYKIIVYKLDHNVMDVLQYSAYLDVGLNYFVNIYVTIHDLNVHDEIVNDFKKCLENSRFTGIGVKIIEE